MRDGEGSAHPARGPGERPVALLALAPTQRRRALEDVLVDAGFDVRHAARGGAEGDVEGDAECDTGGGAGRQAGETTAAGLVVPTAAGPGALVLLAGVPRPDNSTPAAVAALRAAGWEHVVVVGGDVRPTAVARALGRGARGFLVAAPGPVDRVPQPDAPGCHHQTPCASSGSTPTHNFVDTTPTSIGMAVTMKRGVAGPAPGVVRHATSAATSSMATADVRM